MVAPVGACVQLCVCICNQLLAAKYNRYECQSLHGLIWSIRSYLDQLMPARVSPAGQQALGKCIRMFSCQNHLERHGVFYGRRSYCCGSRRQSLKSHIHPCPTSNTNELNDLERIQPSADTIMMPPALIVLGVNSACIPRLLDSATASSAQLDPGVHSPVENPPTQLLRPSAS